MKKSRLLGAVAIFIVSLSSNASLLDNGNTTIDTGTGLEWLDITLTVGQSYNDVLASSFVTTDGYQYATEAEVEQLFTNAGGTPTPGPAYLPSNIAPAQLLLDLMGCTSYLIGVPCDGAGEDWAPAMWGSSSEYIALIDDRWNLPEYIVPGGHAGVLTTRSFIHGDDSTSYRADVGSFLVRTSAIPIPAAVWLFGSGLLGLVGMARRKKT